MSERRPEVLVIGGGATGAGIARDLAMRGAEVLLAEAGDFASRASGGNHGMLHSGARYAVKDPGSASECAAENRVLKRIASFCIEDVGGLFVSLPGDDPGYPDRFLSSCARTGVGAREVSAAEAREREPNLTDDVAAAVEVPDGSIDPFFLVWGNVLSAREAGATALNHAPVRSIAVADGRVERAVVGRGKDERTVRPEIVVNAAGAWCGRVASMASLDLPVQVDRGTMVVFNGRVVNGLVNRLRPPSDGDILVPHRTSTILGTTSGPGDLDDIRPTRDDVDRLLHEAMALLPGISGARAVRAYAGVRPLLGGQPSGRDATRGFRVIDHGAAADNMVSVVGGKLTTYRLMAEKVSDAVMAKLGRDGGCRTALEELVPPSRGTADDFAGRAAAGRYGGRAAEVISTGQREEACSCEAVSMAEIEHFARTGDVRDMGDLMRRTRAGMGYCQAGLCAFRMASVLDGDPVARAGSFLAARWKGVEPVLAGQQLRQEAFKAHLFRLYGLDHTTEGEG